MSRRAFRNLPGCRAIKPVGGLDLRWVNQRPPAIAQQTRQAGVLLETGMVLHVGEDAIKPRAAACSARRDQRVRAGMLKGAALIRPTAAEVGHQVAIARAAEAE